MGGKLTLRVAVCIAVLLGVGAFAFASIPHAFSTGDTLQAADLNINFDALDRRMSALETREPFAGTYPAVMGRGEHGVNAISANTWFCGAAPPTLALSSAPLAYAGPATPVTFSNSFGNVIFTNAGALTLNLDPPGWLIDPNNPGSACLPTKDCNPCPTGNVCAEPITFFLKSPTAQTLTIHTYLDDAGSIYVEDPATRQAVTVGQTTSWGVASVPVPAGSFALAFLACSTNGPTIAFAISDTFLTDPAYNLAVDYDRTFHRGGS